MTVEPLVSVIIPAYNASKHIAGTLESVIRQSWKNLEILVVDDGSSDDTAAKVKSFRDPRIRYIYQENRGCSGAKNTALLSAAGDFIQFLDADDLLSDNKIEVQVKQLVGKPLHVAVSKTFIFHHQPGDTGTEIDPEFLYSTDQPFEFLLALYGLKGRIGMIQPNAFLISRELALLAGDYDMSITPAPDEDGEYFCRVILQAKGIIYTPEAINYYRKHPQSQGSLSTVVSHRHAKGGLRSLELKAEHLLIKENSLRVKEVLALHYNSFIYQYHHLYPDLTARAERLKKQLNIGKEMHVGGSNFVRLSKWLGFRNALRLKKWAHHLKAKKSEG